MAAIAPESKPVTPSTEASATSRRPIQKLPTLLVNQIAAGEVVDRPASVVKEIVENAIDAGATRMAIELEQGGIELIRITDDGCGIPEVELPLAIAPHATSKVHRPEDLDRIATMGFRGEALASIASVSRMAIRSRSREQVGACVIEVEGDTISPVRPVSGSIGTSVSVRNLFFNTPARRKFLRTVQTEQGHCVDAACTLAIAHPFIGFQIVCDGRVVLDVPAGQSPRERALSVLGQELREQMLEVSADRFDDARGLSLWGLIGLPAIARATNKSQHVFLNGRPIRDRTIQHAIKEAYRGLIEPGRHPTCAIMIEMDPAAVDVNVHPAKTEVRFRDQSMVHSTVLRAVRDALRAADLTPTITQSTPWRTGAPAMFGPTADGGPMPAEGDGPAAAGSIPAARFVDFFRKQVPAAAQERFSYQSVREAIQRVVPELAQAGEDTGETPVPPMQDSGGTGVSPVSSDLSLPLPARKNPLLQVHNSYIVTEDEHGLVIVDQHALHERVMFEALLARVVGDGEGHSGKPLESQHLLTPAVIQASAAAVARLDELVPLLERIGIDARPLGPDAIGVHAFSSFLFERGVDPIEFMTDLLERSEAEGFAPGSEQALHEVLDMMACKAAVKAGDHMSPTELADLLKLRDLVERGASCPHGRPTSIRLTMKELEKRFGRS